MTAKITLKGTTLIVGGARSGKSAYGEVLIASLKLNPVYIATAQADDEEMHQRIIEHQIRRGTGWTTVEQPLALCEALKQYAVPGNAVLVDCLTLWLSNLMMADKDIAAETSKLADLMPLLAAPVVFVSNEVGMGLVPETALGRDFRDHAGRMNQRIAEAADNVSFIAAGLPLSLKATKRDKT